MVRLDSTFEVIYTDSDTNNIDDNADAYAPQTST